MIRNTPNDAQPRTRRGFYMLNSLYEKLQREAKKENRTVANLIEVWLLEKLGTLDKTKE